MKSVLLSKEGIWNRQSKGPFKNIILTLAKCFQLWTWMNGGGCAQCRKSFKKVLLLLAMKLWANYLPSKIFNLYIIKVKDKMPSCKNYYDDHLEEKFHVRDLGAKKISVY